MTGLRKTTLKLLHVSLFGLVLTSCAPSTQSVTHPDVDMQTGPQLEDRDLGLDVAAPPVTPIAFDSDVSAAAIDRLTENVFGVDGAFLNTERISWADALLNGMPHKSIALAQSAYADLLIKQMQPMASQALAETLPKLQAQPALIRKLITGLPQPTTDHASLATVASSTFQFLHAFDTAVAKADVLPQVIASIHEDLQVYFAKEAAVNADVKALTDAGTITSALAQVNKAADDFGFPIPAAMQAKMNHVRTFAHQVDAVTDAPTALNMLVSLWQMMSPQQRVQLFKATNSDLYDYLAGLSPDDLKCLSDSTCSNLPQWIAKTLVIYPKLQDYGVDRIRAKVNTEGADEVRAEMVAAVAPQIAQLPKMLGDRIEKGINEALAPVTQLQTNFGDAIRTRLDNWAKKSIEKTGPAIYQPQPARAHLKVDGGGNVSLTWTALRDDTLENKGAMQSLTTFLWERSGLPRERARSLLLLDLSRLAKDYTDSSLQNRLSATLGDTVSARAFAEVLRGSSALTLSLRDWERNSYDDLLGTFTAQDLFPEFQLPALKQTIFPKGSFFALSFSNLADELRFTTGDRTQVFVVDSQNHVTMANKSNTALGDGSSSSTEVMAGIADRVDDRLAPTVRAEDVASYLLSMCQVLESMRSIEDSKSPYLTQKGQDGQVPRDEIIQNRDRIRMLILGLANYLSHQFRAGGELVQHELVIATEKPPADAQTAVNVYDQAISIRALVAAADELGIELYRWEAVDLISALNRNLYRRDLGFYGRIDDKSVSPIVLVEMLRAADTVQPYLKPASRHQLDLLTSPWRQQIARWHLSSPVASDSSTAAN